MKAIHKVILAAILGATAAGCAGTKQLTQQEMLQQYPAITRLEQAVATARQNNVDIYAPDGFAAAEQQLKTAAAAGKRSQKPAVGKATSIGLAAIDQANRDADNSRDILSEVVQARGKAIDAGARDLFPKDTAELDNKLSETANLIERSKVEKAKQIRPELRQAYSDLELRTLKQGTVQRAELAVLHARKNDAHKLAPKTFNAAQESLTLATSLLEANRTDRDKAETAAQRAVVLADRSSNIAELIKDFDRRDFESEDIVLWYQEQLAASTAPLDRKLQFNEPNKVTIQGLKKDINALIDDRRQLASATQRLADADVATAALNTKHAEEIAMLKQEAAGEQAQLTASQQDRERKFSSIQQMYSADEADVFRQKDNVVISVRGVKFPTGSSEIEPHSFALMNKIIKSIQTFDNPVVQIVGHTDATGGAEANRKLSAQRADSVARFLSDVGGYPADRIKAEGMGSDKPIASDATPEGRAQNRRIDVMIINKPAQ